MNAVQSGETSLSFLRPDSNQEEGRNPVTRRRSNSSPTRDGERNGRMEQQLPQRSPFGIQQLLGLSGNGSPSINRSNPDRFKNGGQNDLLPPPATFAMSHHHHQLFPGSMMSHPSLANSSLSGNHCFTNHSIASGQSSPHQGQNCHQVSNVPSSSSSSSSSPSAPSPASFSAPTTSSSFSQAAADSAARLAYLTSSPAAAALMSASMATMSAAAHHHHQIHLPPGHHPGTMSMFHPAFTSSPSGSVDPMTGVPHGKTLIDTFLIHLLVLFRCIFWYEF